MRGSYHRESLALARTRYDQFLASFKAECNAARAMEVFDANKQRKLVPDYVWKLFNELQAEAGGEGAAGNTEDKEKRRLFASALLAKYIAHLRAYCKLPSMKSAAEISLGGVNVHEMLFAVVEGYLE